MAETHEQGPESLRGADLSTPPDDKHVPDCSNCQRSWQLIGYLETGEGPFVVEDKIKVRLLRVLRNSSDMGAFAVEIFNQGICPFAMLQSENLEAVKLKVPIKSCQSFDLTYRPGLDLL